MFCHLLPAMSVGLLTVMCLAPGPARADTPDTLDAWKRHLGATALISPACIDVIAGYLSIQPDTLPTVRGEPLNREHGAEARQPMLTAMNAAGGLPYLDKVGRLRRVKSSHAPDAGDWQPVGNAYDIMPNRGAALVEVVPGRHMLLFDHMPSPITSSSSIWEAGARGFRRLAHFPGEIVSLEDGPTHVQLHLSDTMTAVAVAWDKAKGTFVGQCLVRMEAAASGPEGLAGSIRNAVPTAARNGRHARVLHLLGPSTGEPFPDRIGTIAPHTAYIELLRVDEGWVLVLAPARDASAEAGLFRGPGQRVWRIGWLAR